MSSQLKLRRGSTVAHSTFTGADGEVTFDTDKTVVVSHDGTTVGGFPHTKAADLSASSGASLVGYRASTGATARTLESKSRERISIIDFGAVGGGVDDSVAAQAAVDYVASLGDEGTVFIPKGSWKFNIEMGAKLVHIYADKLSAKVTPFDITKPAISLYGLATKGRTISGINFESVGKAGTAIYFNGYGSNKIYDCDFIGFEYAIYSNSSEWNTFSNLSIKSCFCGISYVTKTGDVFNKNPLFTQHPCASYVLNAQVSQCDIGVYIDGEDNIYSDNNITISFRDSLFLSNQLAIGARNGGSALYAAMVLDNVWNEANATSGTVVINGNTLSKGVVDIQGGNLDVRNFVFAGKFTFENCTTVGRRVSVLNNPTMVITNSNFYFDGVFCDGLGATNITWAECRNVEFYRFGRNAFLQTPIRASVIDGHSLNLSPVTHCAFGAKPGVWSGSPTQTFVQNDGFYGHACLEISGVAADAVHILCDYDTASYYVATMALKSTSGDATITASSASAGIIAGSLSLTSEWKQFSFIGQSVNATSGYGVLTFNSTATIRVSCIQIVKFASKQDAVRFLNSETVYIKGAKSRTFETSSAPTIGTWAVGDIAWHSAPAASGHAGWICTVDGTPGTWKTFGAISA